MSKLDLFLESLVGKELELVHHHDGVSIRTKSSLLYLCKSDDHGIYWHFTTNHSINDWQSIMMDWYYLSMSVLSTLTVKNGECRYMDRGWL